MKIMKNRNLLVESYTHIDNGGIEVQVLDDGTIVFETSYFGYPSVQTRLSLPAIDKKKFMENMESLFSRAKEYF